MKRPTITVCPICGPKALMFAGRIISRICDDCRRDGWIEAR
jgi:hypothetical protein